MIDEYRKSLDELRFSPEAKRRLAQALEAAAAPEQPRRTSRRTRTLAIAAAAAVLALVVGCTAYASGMLDRQKPAKTEALPATEVVDGVGRPVAHATSNGVTVTAEAVVGDRTNYAVVLTVAKDDGTAFEGVRKNADGTLALKFGNLATVTIDGAPSRGTTSYFFDADPDDNAIQFVKASAIDAHGGGFIGKPVRVKLLDLMALDEDGKARTLVEGAWRMSFLANCADLSRNVPAGQTFAFDEGTVTINAITISPLSLSVDLMIDFPIEVNLIGFDTPQSKRLQGLPLTVNMKDGTVVDATQKSGGAVEVREHATVAGKSLMFDRFLDLDEVASITVGGRGYPDAVKRAKREKAGSGRSRPLRRRR